MSRAVHFPGLSAHREWSHPAASASRVGRPTRLRFPARALLWNSRDGGGRAERRPGPGCGASAFAGAAPRLRCGATGYLSAGSFSANDGRKSRFRVVTLRRSVKLVGKGKEGNPLASAEMVDVVKQPRRRRLESELGSEAAEDAPELLVRRSNARHTDQTGISRGGLQRPTVNFPKDRPSPVSDSDLGCEHFSRCSGCVLENALYRPPVLREAVMYFKRLGVDDFSFTAGNSWEWRCRAKLAVRGTAEHPLIGLFEKDSHIIADIPNCRSHHPRINEAVELLKTGIRRLGIEPYNEESQSGHLRYVQMVVSTYNTSLPESERYAKGKVQVALVWNAKDENSVHAKLLKPLAEYLWWKGGPRCSEPILHSIWANLQSSNTNTIFGSKWIHLLGEQDMWERLAGVDICFTPASFGQANLQLVYHLKAFGALVKKLQTYVKRGSAVVELYAGVGVIGLSLAATRACRSVKCVEVNKESKPSFQASLSRIPASVNSKISWHCADASLTPIVWLQSSDVVIVDPPRKGLDGSVIEALQIAALRGQGRQKSAYPSAKVEKRPWVLRATNGVTKEDSDIQEDEWTSFWPHTLIYVSCGWQAFKQDCAALTKDDIWSLHESHSFNFFPGTDSIEILAVFKCDKKGKKRSKVMKKVKMVKMGQNSPGRKSMHSH